MRDDSYRIFSLGDSALTVEFGTTISTGLNDKAVALAAYFEHFPFPGLIEAAPAYASATIFYDVIAVRRAFPEFSTAFEAARSHVQSACQRIEVSSAKSRKIDVPVDFGPAAAPDLDFVADVHAVSRQDVIDIFIATTYRVFMIGFLPGFAYMGEVDERIATPRRSSPRMTVPRGSIGIADRQTGIYSLTSPGGWQIIGCTDMPMFDPTWTVPSHLQPGDEVRFVLAK